MIRSKAYQGKLEINLKGKVRTKLNNGVDGRDRVAPSSALLIKHLGVTETQQAVSTARWGVRAN